MDRIKINNDWYIKEELQTGEELQIFESYEKIYEDINVLLEATFNDKDFKDLEMINYKDKHSGEIELWDNQTWIEGVCNGDKSYIKELLKCSSFYCKYFLNLHFRKLFSTTIS
mgnify:CR=1 FL=1